ncbi:MAG: hypothetical protein AB1733_14055 [Thermodesulfobacteriota bacterium]
MESPLEEVTAAPCSEAIHSCVSPVSPAKALCQPVLSLRYCDKVDMVGHETPNKYRNSVPVDFFSQHSKILTTVRFFMKHVHRPNTTLRCMVLIAGDHYARQTSHYLLLQDDLMIVNKNLVYVTRNHQKSPEIAKIEKDADEFVY